MVSSASEMSLASWRSQWAETSSGSWMGPRRMEVGRHSRMTEGGEPGACHEYHRHASPSCRHHHNNHCHHDPH